MELTCLTDRKVYLNGKLLDPKRSQKVVNHSPDGFMWGYHGSGPAQLALAVMLEMITDDMREWKRHYQDFKKDVIARLPQKPCALEMDFFAWYSGEKDYRFDVHELDGMIDDKDSEDDFGTCTFPQKCQTARISFCDCACGDKNHGVQARLFT